MENFKIKIELHTQERLFEIINSMSKPQICFNLIDKGVPSLKIWFWNKGGVVKYVYLYSGLIGRNILKNKILEYNNIIQR